MNRVVIELKKEHRGGNKSTSFAGREEGKLVREALLLDEKDKDNILYKIIMPEDTTSFNPSFYLGLFFPSIYLLKWDEFRNKYQIDLSNFSTELQPIIQMNLEECERKAKNELDGIIAF